MSKHSIAELIRNHYPDYYKWESYPADQCACIHKVNEEWGILSNFGETPLTVDGVTFVNVEQLFQMMKFRDPAPLMELYKNKGLGIKMKAKKWENDNHRRDDWGEMLVDAIKFCLMQKYEQCPAFREKLLSSKGKFIVEDQTANHKKSPDTWGVKRKGDAFEGPNLLGRLLMELRDNGTLTYHLPDDALAFIDVVRNMEK